MKQIHPHIHKVFLTTISCFGFVCASAQVISISKAKSDFQTQGFIENKGQINSLDSNLKSNQIYFQCNIGNRIVFVTANGLIYQKMSYPTQKNSSAGYSHFQQKDAQMNGRHLNDDSVLISVNRLDMNLIGAHISNNIEPINRSNDYTHYYNCGITEKVYAYKVLKVLNIYPGIDWMLEINAVGIKHSFIVHPNANPNIIKWEYDNQTFQKVDQNGNLIFGNKKDTIKELAPISFQETNTKVKTKFESKNGIWKYSLDKYSAEKELVIDPELDLHWSTYYGGKSVDYCRAIDCDDDGNVYSIGSTNTISTLVTKYASIYTGNKEIFIVKFDTAGNRIWGVFYGGTGYDIGNSLAINSKLNTILITGYTNSSNGIYNGIFSDSFAKYYSSNGNKVIIAKFDLSGNFKWGRYINSSVSSNLNIGEDIVCMSSGVFYVGGTTTNSGLGTSGVFKDTIEPLTLGTYDSYLAKFATNGDLLWYTYYGGKKDEELSSIDVDVNGNLYALGYTNSSNNKKCIATDSAFRTTLWEDDLFLVKFNSNGQRIWGTYFGSTGQEYAPANGHGKKLKIYKNNLVITASSDYNCYSTSCKLTGIGTKGAYLETPTNMATTMPYLASFDLSGHLNWGTYITNKTGFGDGLGLTINSKEEIFVTGETYEISQITKGNVFQNINTGNNAFISRFSKDGKLISGTYFGSGSPSTRGMGIFIHKKGYLYLCGSTGSIPLKNPFQKTTDSIRDGFIAKFCYSVDTNFEKRAIKKYYWAQTKKTYTKSGNYYDTLRKRDGCDSFVVLKLQIDSFVKIIDTAKICDQYKWKVSNQIYSKSSTYYDTFFSNNINTLDTLHVLKLTILKSTYIWEMGLGCDSFIWATNNKIYRKPGKYSDTVFKVNPVGCDSIRQVDVYLFGPETDTLKASNCYRYFWKQKAKYYYQSGFYYDTLADRTSNGCYKIKVLQLNIKKSGVDSVNVNACDSFYWKDTKKWIKKTGVYSQTLTIPNYLGCDSVHIVNVKLNKTTVTQFYDTAKDLFYWPSKNITITQSGVFIDTVKSRISNCDSISIIHLTILKSSVVFDAISACHKYTWPLNNQLYKITGQYSYTLPILNRFGGDSVHVLNLTIVNPNNTPLDYSIVPKLKDTLLCFQPFVDILLPKIANVRYTWLDDADSVATRRIYHDTFQIVRLTQGCFERIDSFQIKLIAKPRILGLADTIVCNVPFNTKLTAKNADWIRWNDGDTSLTKSIVTLGKYLYQAGNICGIVGDSFVVRQGLVPQKIIKDSIVFCEGKPIEINGVQSQIETFKYQWDGGSKSPIFSLKNGGVYRLITTSFCGSRTDSVVAIEEFCGCKMCIPNAFTPTNSDGLNDGWIPRWDCSEHECHIQSGVYQIYNRWGEKIADNSVFMPWDGKYKGQVVQEGLYIYKINAKWDDSYPKSKRIIQSGYILVLSGLK